MKSPQQQLREAAVVAGCTAAWTTVAVISFDQFPAVWFQQSIATFGPIVGHDVAIWILPAAILTLFVAGWIATMGLIFQVFRWHIRDDDRPSANVEPEGWTDR